MPALRTGSLSRSACRASAGVHFTVDVVAGTDSRVLASRGSVDTLESLANERFVNIAIVGPPSEELPGYHVGGDTPASHGHGGLFGSEAGYRSSIMRLEADVSLGRTAAHELGHVLGSGHDYGEAGTYAGSEGTVMASASSADWGHRLSRQHVEETLGFALEARDRYRAKLQAALTQSRLVTPDAPPSVSPSEPGPRTSTGYRAREVTGEAPSWLPE